MILPRPLSLRPARDAIPGLCFLFALAAAIAAGALRTDHAPSQENLRSNVIIPNIDDDDGDGIPDGRAPVVCRAADEEMLQIRIKPNKALPRRAAVRIEIAEPWTRFARAFIGDSSAGGFQLIQGPVALNSDEVKRNGVLIGVEATDFADAGRPPELELIIFFETREGRPLQEERVTCTVAPFLISCCLDPVDSVHVVKTDLTEQFVADLAPLVQAAGAELKVFEDAALPKYDIWIQDAMEIGLATDGQRLIHIVLQGNRGKKLDGLLAKKLLGKDFGTIQKGKYRGDWAQWIDWFGNLEVSPAVKVKSRKFPQGRIYAGTQGERAMHPEVIEFLEAQGAQVPVLWLDTSWLIIGHVDETVSWVSSRVGRPYRMLIPSARLAVEILKKTEELAPGSLLNRGTMHEGDAPGEYERPLAEALNDKDLMAAQEFVQKKIDGVRRTLQEGLGVADEDIIEIPVLFSSPGEKYAGRYSTETTNMVNSLLVGNTFIVPDPHGPLLNGKDVLLQAVKDRLEPLGCRVLAVNNFYPYHRFLGEVHCGTNATRRPASSPPR
ncbi:MAG: protein-arginine deiminase family protein [Candidatus Aminicenantales bacterium]